MNQSCGSWRRLIDKSGTAEDRKAAQEAAVLKRSTDGMNAQYAINKYMVVSVMFAASMKTEVWSRSETTLTVSAPELFYTFDRYI